MYSDRHPALLRHAPYIELQPDARARFCHYAAQVDDWRALIEKAESNALSGLLYQHIKNCDIKIADENRRTLRALMARHTRNNRERIAALAEILPAFAKRGIASIVLKGMALIHVLYDNPCLRPMSDIDILVDADHALLAQQILRDIGYNATDRKQDFSYDHHHLPMAIKTRNGLMIQVEIHHNALSGDVAHSITFAQVFKRCLSFDVAGSRGYALAPQDMLLHLCHHTFEPIEDIRLGAIADIYGIATRYQQQIDWRAMQTTAPYIINTLRCLHLLSPLPQTLSAILQPPDGIMPSGIGKGFLPLSNTLDAKKPAREKFRRIFNCSAWWLHVQYIIPPEHSLLFTRLVRHPLQVGRWLYRRLLAKLKSRMANANRS